MIVVRLTSSATTAKKTSPLKKIIAVLLSLNNCENPMNVVQGNHH